MCGPPALVLNLDRQRTPNNQIRLHEHVVDLTDADNLGRAMDMLLERFGVPDILVNNAGISQRMAAEEYPLDDCLHMGRLNIWAPFQLMQRCAKTWKEQRQGGCVVNIASVYGLVADPMSAPYSASKGALIQLTRTCAVEWARHSIRVNAVAPGYTRTEMTAQTLDSPAGIAILSRVPLGRAATTDEIAAAVCYLSSAEASFVTGHVLVVDGGYSAQ